jgi:hypothetical protein
MRGMSSCEGIGDSGSQNPSQASRRCGNGERAGIEFHYVKWDGAWCSLETGIDCRDISYPLV